MVTLLGVVLSVLAVFLGYGFLSLFLQRNGVVAAPDYLYVSLPVFGLHFLNILLANILPADKRCADGQVECEDYIQVLGYSCRTLFESLMSVLTKENPDLRVGTTSLHHTSFKLIMEQYVKPNNIIILDVDASLRVVSAPKTKVDIVVFTHMFGRDFDIKELVNAKKQQKFLLIEDRCQGGSLVKDFCAPETDLAMYSMGMDKRPISMGGGFVNFRKTHKDLANKLRRFLKALPQESSVDRFGKLLAKIPTWLLYNSKVFLSSVFTAMDIMNLAGVGVRFNGTAQAYRKANPGFEHDKYMKSPSAGMQRSMMQQINNYQRIEKATSNQYIKFTKALGDRTMFYMPWHTEEPSQSIYNTVYLEPKLVPDFIEYMETARIIVVSNPTYKMMAASDCPIMTRYFEGIVYLPSLGGLSNVEIQRLAKFLRAYADRVDKHSDAQQLLDSE
eukprot:gb/GEZN01005702.1/.p1 GENE.gb/GEZN01005702.1/~~gb/GEZN01005702.1/.p1  ORF type:complete len:445 (-),score=66.38 gb/GEZN01005702.1/:292-1626(-)